MIGAGFDALVCDLDGVVYRGDGVITGAPEMLQRLRNAGIKLVFCTNNSRSTVDQYLSKLTGLGVAVDRSEILTSGLVTARVLRDRGFAGRRAIVIGGPGVSEALTDEGIEIDEDPESHSSDLVIVGWDPEFDYPMLRRAVMAVRAGATLVATNADATFPAPDGLWPGAGSILAAIEKGAGAQAEVMGKPNPPTMAAIDKLLDGSRHVACIGDRPDTDLAGGVIKGWTTILVLSGVTAPEDVGSIEPPPDYVIDSIADLDKIRAASTDQ
ncbi:MAG: HAD-IIA family hydrolase [Actinomycetota bacterium]